MAIHFKAFVLKSAHDFSKHKICWDTFNFIDNGIKFTAVIVGK